MQNSSRSRAVSEVVGEMLMIGIVLVLAAAFTSQLPNYLPSERSPTVTIMMSDNLSAGTITLWHKGGDWVKAADLKVIVASNQTSQTTFTFSHSPKFVLVSASPQQSTITFDLGGNITVTMPAPLVGDEKVTLATDHAVLFTGIVGGELP
jgi:FlaG/FlaF family flagellin (archaellin)